MLSKRLAATLQNFIRVAIGEGVEFGGKPSDSEVARRVERFVEGTPPRVQKRFRCLLLALWGVPALFYLKTFPRLLPAEQRRVVARWANSRLYYPWFSFDALKSLCMLVYYSDPSMERQVEYSRPCDKG
jgi:hypothetical protein